ncbi:YWTD domain-containing protein [Didymella exigua CBS 183.55]|uniref:YWTD domain-containing protein n=1 Tax=Didymella exigua CBS 183.55 TaxID=1150837 RepID=A0A6A5R751_9PLEO|nr:YWTD domain-containing protein [Didymella exigua CBS 183.55]KAF1923985.1 YWTD domain-containing protein [Didymella exigua CBS 183.55]
MPSVQQCSSLAPRRLLVLDCALSNPNFSNGRVFSTCTHGAATQDIVSDMCTLPDGIALDRAAGHMYVTHMGGALSTNSGSIMRYDLDGSNAQCAIAQGSKGVWTPKQVTFAQHDAKKWIYWCDREGMKLCRACVDTLPATPEVLLETGDPALDTDRRRWCVGVAVDAARGTVYWSQKGAPKASEGRIFRAQVDDVRGTREVLFERLPEPIDLDLDAERGVLYWADRGDPPRGNSLNRAFVGSGQVGEVEILATRFHEAIGLALDTEGGKCYVSDLAGGLYEVDLQTRKKKVLFPELGDLTGIALV